MTLLQEDLSGINKENWKKQAEQFLELVDLLYKNSYIYIDNQGIAMWKTSNKIIPQGYLDALLILKVDFDYKQTTSLRKMTVCATKNHYKTRFIKDIKSLDKFWKRYSFNQVVERQKDYLNGTLYIDIHGVARWKTNNHVIPRECLEQLAYSGICPRIYFEKNDKFRNKEINEIFRGN